MSTSAPDGGPTAAPLAFPQFADLGRIPLTTITAAGGQTEQMPDGSYRTWLAISGQPAAGEPAYLAEIDPFQRTVLRTFPMPNAQGAWGVSVAENGDVFASTYGEGRAYWLPWGEDEIVDLGPAGPDTSFLWEGDTDEDGVLYAGTFEGFGGPPVPQGRLVSWDPRNDSFRDYGSFGNPAFTNVRSVAVDGDTIYVGVGPTTGFFAVDAVTGAKTQLPFPPGYAATDQYTYQMDVAGDYMYVRFLGGASPIVSWLWDLDLEQWVPGGDFGTWNGQSVSDPVNAQQQVWLVQNGTLVRYDPGSTSVVEHTTMTGLGEAKGLNTVVDPVTGKTLVVFAQPNGQMALYDPVTGEGDLVAVQGLTGTTASPRSIAVGPDGRVYAGGWFTFDRGLVAYDPDTAAWTNYPFPHQTEAITTIGDTMYLGVYPDAQLFAYKPAEPFGPNNPRKLFELGPQGQSRPWAIAPAGDQVAIGTSPVSGLTNGMLALYDPDTENLRIVPGVGTGQQVVSLAYRSGVLYAGTLGCCPGQTDGKLFAVDVSTAQVLWEKVPLPGQKGVNALAFDPTGRLYGMAAGTMFEFNVTTRAVVRQRTFWPYDWSTVTNFVPRAVNLTWDPNDGHLYGSAISHVFRVNPTTMTETHPNIRGNMYAWDHVSGAQYWTQYRGFNLITGRWYAPPS
ncbi:hypothetical protein C1I92_28180 [Jiangella anatolica]|uniref:PQQ-binding-like beta-propeller repeat protein n=1 Tax=Jiangella anatolica TaxID=2670374 RepID=A0A2W2B4V6_9ACTN|nr:hypothetical protein C1I92_28180 [Jiangella anatolica]